MSLFNSSKSLVLAALVAVLAAPALAGQLDAAGDGSATDNPDLLSDGVGTCPNCEYTGVPREYIEPPFDLDWRVALRGGYVQSTSGDRFEGTVAPSVTFTTEGLRSSFVLDAGAEIAGSTIEPFRIAALRLNAAADYELDSLTTLRGGADLSFSQAATTAAGSPAGVVSNSQILSADGDVAVVRDMGFLDIELRGTGGRSFNGPTELGGGVLVHNTWMNDTRIGAGLRVSRAITPIMTLFADATAGYQYFDGPSPTLLVKLDGPTYTLKGGFSAEWNSVLAAEASAGVGLRRFNSGIADVTATLYDARLVFRPDETLTLEGVFGTSFAPPGTSGGTTRITYTADANANYRVNPWLALRASAGWYRTDIVGTGAIETGWGAGVGADYSINDQVALTADYTFSHAEALPAAPVDTHKYLVGVTFSR